MTKIVYDRCIRVKYDSLNIDALEKATVNLVCGYFDIDRLTNMLKIE